MRFFKKLATAARVLHTVKNSHTYIKDYRRQLHGTYTLTLRSGETFTLRAGTCDRGILTEVWVNNCYPLPADCSGMTIIDLGAQIGMFSVFAARRGARVIAFEPVPENYALLRKNVAQNKLRTVTTEMAAVSGKPGVLTIYLDTSNTGGHSALTQSNHAVRVKATTLAAVFKKYGLKTCDVLKIDTEGSEYAILYNTPAAVLRRVKSLLLETHDLPGKGTNTTALAAFLKKQGFLVTVGEGYIFASRS